MAVSAFTKFAIGRRDEEESPAVVSSFTKSVASAVKVQKPAPFPTLSDSLKPESPPPAGMKTTTPQVSFDPTLLSIIDPRKPTSVRPIFGTKEEKLPYGGPLVGGVLDVAARLAEAPVRATVQFLSNARKVIGNTETKVPFDPKRLGFEVEGGGNVIPSTGDRYMKALEKTGYLENPSFETIPKAAGAFLMTAGIDAIDAAFAGDLARMGAQGTLQATRYAPEVDKALQQMGLKGKDVTVDAIKEQFVSRGNRLIAAKDYRGLDELGQATHALMRALAGRGVPKLTKLGQLAEDAARMALRDVRKPGGRARFGEIAPEKRVEGLPGYREEPGQAPAFGLSTKRTERVGGEEPELTTKILERVKGRESVSRQFIEDLTNSPDLKQAERDLVRNVLSGMEGAQISIPDFANKVKSELLPLKRNELGITPYENISLPDDLRGPIANYTEHLYESPIKTSAGGVHYNQAEYAGKEGYFAHTRIEDLPTSITEDTRSVAQQLKDAQSGKIGSQGGTRRVIELQSDLFQKGRLEEESGIPYLTKRIESINKQIEGLKGGYDREAQLLFPDEKSFIKERQRITKEQEELYKQLVGAEEKKKTLSKLEPYRNTWHERVIREEIKQAAKDGKTKLQFPTGETAMKIEGLGSRDQWGILDKNRNTTKLTPENMQAGQDVYIDRGQEIGEADRWIITDILGDGKFKAVPKNFLEENYSSLEEMKKTGDSSMEETFDISGKVDTSSPIYKFYEKEVGRYLAKKYGGKRVKDAQGVEWWEVEVKPEMGKGPVEAFGIAGGADEDEDGNVRFDPLGAGLGVIGAGILGKIAKKIAPELAAALRKEEGDVMKVLGNAGIKGEAAVTLLGRLSKGMDEAAIEQVLLEAKVGEIEVRGDLVDTATLPLEDKFKVNDAVARTEEDSLDLMAKEASEFTLNRSRNAEERVVSNLESVFAEMKGVSLDDLKLKFSEEELEQARLDYTFLEEALLNDPARALVKYRSRETGKLPEVTGTDAIKSPTGSGKDIRNSEFGRKGDQILQEIFGFERKVDGDEAQAFLDSYLKRREGLQKADQKLRDIRHNIRLAKQKDDFIGKTKDRLARETAANLKAMRALVQAAEREGFKRGFEKGSERYGKLVATLRKRRGRITAVKHAFNLTDAQMKKVRGPDDPRFMTEDEFDDYLKDVEARALEEQKKMEERVIIDALVKEKELKKVENLQRALELPPLKDMTLEQLGEFSSILSKTRYFDTFLGPRMIQTAKNTDLGDVKTLGEARDAIAKQTGMPFTKEVEGSKLDRWLRDPTLAERDPLHKIFITEWAAKEADMLTKKFQLEHEVTKLAKASRKSRRKINARLEREGTIKRTVKEKAFQFLAPQDMRPRAYAEAAPEHLADLEQHMTPEEIAFGRFLRDFFHRYYQIAQEDASNRWTLRGVKFSRFRDMYFPHMTRSFFERWRDDGFVKALKLLWDKGSTETKIDFNAFGDRGEVLGYEKWLKYSMRREGEGAFSENAPRAVLSYFHAFERKLLLDSMIPKIKMLEFVMGKRFQTPKSVSNPEGAEQVHSELRRHVNEWINNKKGQRVEMVYAQGDRAETVVDALRLLISVQQLGVNLIAQVISGVGGEAINFSGRGIKGWFEGHTRALTKEGRELSRKHAGVIGTPPWNELASAANDMGDTLRSGIFYIFGDLAYRARRQFFLASLTKEEFKTGEISAKRLAEIKLDMGKWHAMPEFRSVGTSTGIAKAALMYTEWALPIAENTLAVLLPRLRNMARSTEAGKWKAMADSKEFKTLLWMVISGAALSAMGYLLFNPDENDHSALGRARRKAAQEIGSIFQAMATFGIPIPGSVFIGFLDQLRNALGTLLTLERYETAGAGHKAGDLKGPDALGRVLIPRGIQNFIPEEETPLRTREDIRKEIRDGLKSGELSTEAAKIKLARDLKSLEKQEKDRRFELSKDAYRKDLKRRVEAGDISIANAKKEVAAYLKQNREKNPESFESDSDEGFIDAVSEYAKAIGTDPVTAFQHIFTGQIIRRTDNGAIIVRRMPYEASQAVRKDLGANKDLILDHTIPLQLGGTNLKGNLKLVPREDWERYTPVENYLGELLRRNEIEPKEARRLIKALKDGKMTEVEVYAETH